MAYAAIFCCLFAIPGIAGAEGARFQGERVRLRLAGDYQIGALVRADHDSVVIRHEDGGILAARSDVISALERSEGSRGHPGIGALVGAVCGLVVGAIIVREEGGSTTLLGGVGTGNVTPIMIGPLLGAGVGALAGTYIRTEQWVPMPRPWNTTPDASIHVALTIPLGVPARAGQ